MKYNDVIYVTMTNDVNRSIW